MWVIAKGLLIGFSIAAPVGPIGVLCIQQTLTNGWRAGFVTGLGAATADAVYAMIAGYGVTGVATLLFHQKVIIHLAGGLFLCYLGIRTVLAPSLRKENTPVDINSSGAFATTFILTLTNPITILSFSAVFASLGIAEAQSRFSTATGLIMGVFLGSIAWWVTLSTGVSYLRQRMSPKLLLYVNRISGGIILLFGLSTLILVVFS